MSQPIISSASIDTLANSKLTVYEQACNRPLPSALTPGAALSLEDKLALDRQLAQFVLFEAEAMYRSPVRHFFNPGGQQLLYNHN